MKGSELELQDEDAFTQPDDGWKRINTLGHYNVQDNSTIHLVLQGTERQNSAEEEPHVIVSANGTAINLSIVFFFSFFMDRVLFLRVKAARLL